jgi:single-stranded DNA-binding protein
MLTNEIARIGFWAYYIDLRNYNDKNGVERQAVEIVANDVRMLQSKPKGGEASTELGEPDLDGEEFP